MVGPEFGVLSQGTVNVPPAPRALEPERPGMYGLSGQLPDSKGNFPFLSHGDLQMRNVVLSELAEAG